MHRIFAYWMLFTSCLLAAPWAKLHFERVNEVSD